MRRSAPANVGSGPPSKDQLTLLGLQLKSCGKSAGVPRGAIPVGGDTADRCSPANLESLIRVFDPPWILLKPTVGESHTIRVASATPNMVEVLDRTFLAYRKLNWVGCTVVHNVEQKKPAKV